MRPPPTDACSLAIHKHAWMHPPTGYKNACSSSFDLCTQLNPILYIVVTWPFIAVWTMLVAQCRCHARGFELCSVCCVWLQLWSLPSHPPLLHPPYGRPRQLSCSVRMCSVRQPTVPTRSRLGSVAWCASSLVSRSFTTTARSSGQQAPSLYF